MRSALVAFSACLLFGGCGSPAANPMNDLSTGGKDGPVQEAMDLTVAATKTGCNGYIQCLVMCGSDMACSAMCDKNVTTVGKQKFRQAISCGQNWCLGTNDMGSGDCALNAAMTMLVDPPGKPAKTCSTCLNNSLASLFGSACAPLTDKNCNPPMCTGTVTACTASTP